MQEKHGISRREYMQMIKEQAIYLNDTLVESMVATTKPGDTIEIRQGKKILLNETIADLRKKKKMIVLFNKPKGFTVAKEDKHNKTIYQLLPESWQKDFYYIGRLDKDSHGLLLLTNDPSLVDFYEKPGNKINKIYEVQIDMPMRSQDIEKAKKGVLADEDGVMIKPDTKKGKEMRREAPPQGVELLKVISMQYQPYKGKHFVTITLNEGKKRHIRRLLKALGYMVKDLKRTKVGIYQLGTIKPGKYMMQPYKGGSKK